MDKQERINKVYYKTDGYCHICHKKLSLSNYGKRGAKGAWHIEHSKAKANGGTDHLNNLFPACISCNEDKGVLHTRIVRAYNGQTRAPLSKKSKEAIKKSNRNTGTVIGSGIGMILGGPIGGLFGGILGNVIGDSNSLKK